MNSIEMEIVSTDTHLKLYIDSGGSDADIIPVKLSDCRVSYSGKSGVVYLHTPAKDYTLCACDMGNELVFHCLTINNEPTETGTEIFDILLTLI